MTSKTSSPTDDAPMPRLFDALTTHEYNDVTGTVVVNVADALMAIATAINRLATIQENAALHAANKVDRLEAMVFQNSGHG